MSMQPAWGPKACVNAGAAYEIVIVDVVQEAFVCVTNFIGFTVTVVVLMAT